MGREHYLKHVTLKKLAKNVTWEYARAWLNVEATEQLPVQVSGVVSPHEGFRVQVVFALESRVRL